MGAIFIASDSIGAGKSFFALSMSQCMVDKTEMEDGDVSVVSIVDNAKNISHNMDRTFKQKYILIANAEHDLSLLKKTHNKIFIEISNDIPQKNIDELIANVGGTVIVITDYRNIRAGIKLALQYKDNLKGLIVNFLPKYSMVQFKSEILPELHQSGINLLGVIYVDRALLSLSIKQIQIALNGTFLYGEELPDNLVENIMVGGFGMDPGEFIFSTKNKKAVIVRGDRPDVQMSALATDLECLILTCGLEPTEYVTYESKEEEVPIILVETTTLETMATVNTFTSLANFDHLDKLNRGCELISSQFNMSDFL